MMYAGLAERSQAMMKDKYNAADGRLGRSDRKETDSLLEVRDAFFQGIANKVSLPVNI